MRARDHPVVGAGMQAVLESVALRERPQALKGRGFSRAVDPSIIPVILSDEPGRRGDWTRSRRTPIVPVTFASRVFRWSEVAAATESRNLLFLSHEVAAFLLRRRI